MFLQDTKYRKVKPEHVLLTENKDEAKISDFYLSLHGTLPTERRAQSPQCVAPEVWETPNDDTARDYDAKVVRVRNSPMF